MTSLRRWRRKANAGALAAVASGTTPAPVGLASTVAVSATAPRWVFPDAALGDGGLARPLAWTEDQSRDRLHGSGSRLVSPRAAGQVLDILREGPMPAGRPPPALARGAPAMAFKTGTSYGYRDALAAGVVGGYVVIVWTGRADGGARPGLTGRDAALPLLFDAADLIALPPAAPRPIAPRAAPPALQQLERPDTGPQIVFPPNNAVVQVDAFGPRSRGLAFAAGGENLTWYVEGEPVAEDPVSHRVIWRPDGPGFYRVTVIDGQGRRAESRIRVRG